MAGNPGGPRRSPRCVVTSRRNRQKRCAERTILRAHQHASGAKGGSKSRNRWCSDEHAAARGRKGHTNDPCAAGRSRPQHNPTRDPDGTGRSRTSDEAVPVCNPGACREGLPAAVGRSPIPHATRRVPGHLSEPWTQHIPSWTARFSFTHVWRVATRSEKSAVHVLAPPFCSGSECRWSPTPVLVQ
jgi:hypothetical protein